MTSTPRLSRSGAAAVLVLAALLASALAAGVANGAGSSKANPKIAYLSFAVANSYDAPMLAAARAVAKSQGASVVVFDAANDPKKQLAQLKTAITSKQYDGIIVQPIFGPQLIPTITQAVKSGVKIVNIDQILGANPGTAAPPVKGLSGNVVFVQTDIGKKQGSVCLVGMQVQNGKFVRVTPTEKGTFDCGGDKPPVELTIDPVKEYKG